MSTARRAGAARPALAVVVPALDEHEALPRLFDSLDLQRGPAFERIVVDGGSRDGTPALARLRGARVIEAGRGRGRQLNAGAAAATAPWLLFLHADCRLTAPTQLRDALAQMRTERAGGDGRPLAGHFALQFERSRDGHEAFYRFLETKSASGRPHSIHGDQGLLIHRDDFAALGGYDASLPWFEDERIAARVFAQGRWLLLPGRLQTSARRFEAEGVEARYTLMAIMMAVHHAGMDEFFHAAPAVYAAQPEARALDLAPFRLLLLRQLRARGLRGAAGVLLRAGQLARENAWQLALWHDLRRGRAEDPRTLAFFDRHLAPRLDHPGADALAGLLAGLWCALALPLQARLQNSRLRRK